MDPSNHTSPATSSNVAVTDYATDTVNSLSRTSSREQPVSSERAVRFYERFSSRRHSPGHRRHRVSVHRILTALFNSTRSDLDSTQDSPVGSTPQSRRTTLHDIFRIGATPTVRNTNAKDLDQLRRISSQSIDIVAPGAFLFSSPDLKASEHGSSFVPSNDSHGSLTFSRRGTNASFISSVVEDALDEFLLEPCDEILVPQSLSEVLLSGVDVGSNEATAIRSERAEDTQSTSNAQVLPSEILHQVYISLSPMDFNSARHTCRKWMTASFDRALLITMLRRGGWLSGLNPVVQANAMREMLLLQTANIDVWKLSCNVSRECALSANWSGAGVSSITGGTSTSVGLSPDNSKNGPLAADDHISRRPAALSETGRVDFQDLANGFAGHGVRQSSGLVFTASVCGEYLMVAEGGMIYIYALEGCGIRPLTSVLCPRRVLAMSMDASSRRFAVAALLEGRMGIVCDLHVGEDEDGRVRAASPSGVAYGMTTVFDESSIVPGPSDSSLSTERLNSDAVQTLEAEPTGSASAFNAVGVQSGRASHQLDNTDNPRHHGRNWINQEWNMRFRGMHLQPAKPRQQEANALLHDNRASEEDTPGKADMPSRGMRSSTRELQERRSYYDPLLAESIPLETGNRSIYRNLCSDDDPPRSVAICPQRRCVAFGCSAGVEIHWVDALTRQSLNRWFPLTEPSDHLFFLSPRAGVDSARKLRLISSAAHPSQRRLQHSRTWLHNLWGGYGFDTEQQPVAAVSVSHYDHYRALPLSDGFHALFIDSVSGYLCLGTDAPLGGRTPLLRKIIFVPPIELKDAYAGGALPVPKIYSATNNLSCGPRVVAAYSDTVVLYAIPPDTFSLSQQEQRIEGIGVWAQRELPHDVEYDLDNWRHWWHYCSDIDEQPSGPPTPPVSEADSVWPLYLRGIAVGRLESGIADLAINETDAGLAVWAFGLDGRGVCWQLGARREEHILHSTVGQDGKVEVTYGVHSIDEHEDFENVAAASWERAVQQADVQSNMLETSKQSRNLLQSPSSEKQRVLLEEPSSKGGPVLAHTELTDRRHRNGIRTRGSDQFLHVSEGARIDLDGTSSTPSASLPHTPVHGVLGRGLPPVRLIRRGLHIENNGDVSDVVVHGDSVYDAEGDIFVPGTSVWCEEEEFLWATAATLPC